MKRLILFASLIAVVVLAVNAQRTVVDDIYLTPNDASMIKELRTSREKQSSAAQAVVYRNGAREVVFIDKNGNKTTAVSDTVFVVDGEVYADSVYQEEGYYLNEFNGSESDLEYADRIRRFHNPRYTITIADPGYNDIYFLDNNYWNVYVDGMYATITPTWNNPYWWNYNYAPYSYNSWAWRQNWGYPHYGYYGWNAGFGWGSPWYSGYYGWYDPWYSGWGGGYYGWGSYYGWGGYYGWDYPYYGGGLLGYGGYKTTNQSQRAAVLSGRSGYGSRSAFDSNVSTRRTAVMTTEGARSANRTDSRLSTGSDRASVANRALERSSGALRGSGVSAVDTRMRTTGSVRTSDEWNSVRTNTNRLENSSSTIVNRTNPGTRSSASMTEFNRSAYQSERSGVTTVPSRSTESIRSNSTYSAPSRSYDSGAGRSSGSISTGSSRSSGGASMGGGGGASRSSGSSGGRR